MKIGDKVRTNKKYASQVGKHFGCTFFEGIIISLDGFLDSVIVRRSDGAEIHISTYWLEYAK